jgi:hypothetical protein
VFIRVKDPEGYLLVSGNQKAFEYNGEVMNCSASREVDYQGAAVDLGIYLNGGTVIASGNMLDHIAQSSQNYAVFQFAENNQSEEVVLKDAAGQTVVQEKLENAFSYLVISAPSLKKGEYSLWLDGVQMQVTSGQQMGGFGGGMGMEGIEPPEGMERPEGMTPPEGMQMPGDKTPPEGMEMPRKPDDMEEPVGERPAGETRDVFTIAAGANYFQIIH